MAFSTGCESIINTADKEDLMQETLIDDYKIVVEDFIYLDGYLLYNYSIESIDGREININTIYKNFPAYVLPVLHNKGLSNTKINRYDFEKIAKDKILVIGCGYFWEEIPPDILHLSFEIIRGNTTKETPKISLSNQKYSDRYKHIAINKNIEVPEGNIYFDSILFTPYNALFLGEIKEKKLFEMNPYDIIMYNDKKPVRPQTIFSEYNEDLQAGQIIKVIDKSDLKDSKDLKFMLIRETSNSDFPEGEVDVEIPDLY